MQASGVSFPLFQVQVYDHLRFESAALTPNGQGPQLVTFEIVSRSAKQLRLIPKKTQAGITERAEITSELSRSMIVVTRKCWTSKDTSAPPSFWLATDVACSVLSSRCGMRFGVCECCV
jgi:hypothetical protein